MSATIARPRTVAQAVDLGATLERPVADVSYGRAGVVRDQSTR
jgi:hypothetical protein